VFGAGEEDGLLLSHTRRSLVRREVGLVLALVAAALAVYAQTARFGFSVFDDGRDIVENLRVYDGLSLRNARWAFRTFHDSNWMPLSWLSLMLDATIYNRWPGGFHITNVLLHVANVLLVFAFFRRATGNAQRSAFIAALFAVHPLHVESVVMIAERKDMLSMLFGLLALCSYVEYMRRRHSAWMAAALVFYLCSLSSKQTFVTLPFVLLLLDVWPLERWSLRANDSQVEGRLSRRLLPLLVEKLPFFTLSVVFCGVAIFAQSRGHAVRTLTDIPLTIRVLNAVLSYGLYLRRAFWPFGLAIFYPHPGPAISLPDVAVALAVLSSVTLLAIVKARRWPFLIVGWLWFLGALVPMIGLVQVGRQQMADRYAYFPFLGLYAAVAWLAPAILSRPHALRRGLPAIATGIIVLAAGVAYQQVGYWRDGVTLMRHALAATGDNLFARSILGDALLAESRVDEALEQYEQAIQLAPRDPLGYFRYGAVLQGLKRFDESARQYRASLELDEANAEAHLGLGLIYCGRRQFGAARRELDRAVELDKNNAEAYATLAALCRTLGQYGPSTDFAERALQIEDDLLYCQRLIGVNLLDQGRVNEAIDRLRRVVAAAPEAEEVRADLARALAMEEDASATIRQ